MRLGLVFALFFAPSVAFAQSGSGVVPRAPHGADASGIDWRWEPFRRVEYGLTFGGLTVAMLARFVAPPPPPTFRGGILFDEALQRRTAMDVGARRSTVVSLTDVGFYGVMAYRLIDSGYVPTFVYGRPEVSLQMAMIDLESFGFVAAVLWLPHMVVGRERPLGSHCRADEKFRAGEPVCAEDHVEHNRSFFAGHAAVAMTGAGLTCTHHRHLPLYGGGLADRMACGLTIASAFATGVGRMVTEKHYGTDVVWGWGVGAFAGFVMPEILHYRHEQKAPALGRDGAAKGGSAPPTKIVQASFMPRISLTEIELGVAGTF